MTSARLSRMRRSLLAVACLSLSGCLAYDNPVQPAYVPVSTSNPASLTMGSLPAVSGSQAVVNARVQNVNGAPLAGIPVMFATDAGTLSNDSGITTSLGIATTIWSGSGTATVGATTGNLNAKTIVVSNPTLTPQPTPALTFLNVQGSATTGVPVTFSVSSSAIGQLWQWSFGDGGSDTTTAFSTMHRYTRAGLYTANVSSSGTVAASATINVTDPVVTPPPAPPPALVVTVSCPKSTSLTQSCNVSASANGSPIGSNAIAKVGWDWGDGKTDLVLGPLNQHTYVSPGTYTVFATGYTADGTSATGSVSVTVAAAPPTTTTTTTTTIPFH